MLTGRLPRWVDDVALRDDAEVAIGAERFGPAVRDALTQAAAAHAAYLALNAGASVDEEPTQPGFSGPTAEQRARAAGYVGPPATGGAPSTSAWPATRRTTSTSP